MAAFLQGLGTIVHAFIAQEKDERSEDWIMSSSIFIPLGIVGVYLLFVKRVGPALMAHRQPLKIQPIIIVFNSIQIVACSYIFIKGLTVMIRQQYSVLCQPVDHTVSEENTMTANLVFVYYMLKISDLLDTAFFVLRKKHSHVSFLHTYHHSGMVIVGFLACNFSLNGHFIMLGVINSFVHAAMYTYYLYAVLFPDRSPGIGIKKSLTMLQLVQFCILFVHEGLPLLQPNCKVQKFWCIALVVQYAFMIALFSDFYKKAYLSPKKKSA